MTIPRTGQEIANSKSRIRRMVEDIFELQQSPLVDEEEN